MLLGNYHLLANAKLDLFAVIVHVQTSPHEG